MFKLNFHNIFTTEIDLSLQSYNDIAGDISNQIINRVEYSPDKNNICI